MSTLTPTPHSSAPRRLRIPAHLFRTLAALLLLFSLALWITSIWYQPGIWRLRTWSRGDVPSHLSGEPGSIRSRDDALLVLIGGRIIARWETKRQWMPNRAGAEFTYAEAHYGPLSTLGLAQQNIGWLMWKPKRRIVAGLWLLASFEGAMPTPPHTEHIELGFSIPLWLTAALGAAPWVFFMLPSRRRQRRRARGVCEYCTYSRAGIDSRLPCPECGKRVSTQT